MSANKVYLITGTSRGIGLALVAHYVKQANTTVIATVRDVSKSHKALEALPAGQGSKVIVVAVSSTDFESPKKAIELLRTRHGISRIDTVIANAGIAEPSAYKPLADQSTDVLLEHYHVNTLAPLVLFQDTKRLLEKSANPTFVVVSSIAGSVASVPSMALPFGAYGQSKAAVNYIFTKLASENPDLNIFVLHPGWVQTDMGNHGAEVAGLDAAPLSLDESIAGIVKEVDSATLEGTSGHFRSVDSAEDAPW